MVQFAFEEHDIYTFETTIKKSERKGDGTGLFPKNQTKDEIWTKVHICRKLPI